MAIFQQNTIELIEDSVHSYGVGILGVRVSILGPESCYHDRGSLWHSSVTQYKCWDIPRQQDKIGSFHVLYTSFMFIPPPHLKIM